MDAKLSSPLLPLNPDTSVYTNLHGLQSIKTTENRDEALKQVAQQFESLMVNMMMKNMRAANKIFEDNSLFNSDETNFYRDMLDQQRSLTFSQGRGLGIADALYRQLKGRQGEAASSVEKNTGALEKPFIGELLRRRQEMLRPTPVSRARGVAISENQQSDTPLKFVKHFLPMVTKAALPKGLDPLVLVAQSALETGWGRSLLKRADGETAENYFNIKTGKNWRGDHVDTLTPEFYNGKKVLESAKFRSYASAEDSIRDYINFIQDSPRYRHALEAADDAGEYIRRLHAAGYATDPHYADKVMSVYEKIRTWVSGSSSGGIQ